MLGEEMQCVICQSFLCAAHALPCSHTFCGDCLVQWLSKKPHCPTCRRPTGGASPTPIHNIDSMIERAASVSPERAVICFVPGFQSPRRLVGIADEKGREFCNEWPQECSACGMTPLQESPRVSKICFADQVLWLLHLLSALCRLLLVG